jgi:PAS domain S-box-containing protein
MTLDKNLGNLKSLEILNKIILEGNKANDMETLLKKVLSLTLELLDFDGGGVYLIDESNEFAQIVSHHSLPMEFIEDAKVVKIDNPPYSLIFKEGKSILTEHYEKINRERSEKWGFLSLASIPIFDNEKIIGVMNVASKSRHTFLDEEERILKNICREIGTTIVKLQTKVELEKHQQELEKLIQKRTEYLSGLNAIIVLGNESTSLQEFLEKAYDHVLELVDFDRGGVYLYDPKTRQNNLVLYKNVHPDFVAAVKNVDISQGVFKKVFDKKKSYYIEDFSIFMENSKELGVYSAAIIPVCSKDRYVGSLNIGSPVYQTLSEKALELLNAIGKQMGIIIQKFEAETKLIESEDKFRTIAEQTLLGLIITQDGNVVYTNDSLSNMFGYSKDELLSWTEQDLLRKVHPDDLPFIQQKYIERKKGKKNQILQYEGRVISKNGEIIWFSNLSKGIKYQGKDATIGAMMDITKLKRSEEALKESEKKYRLILENVHDLITILNNEYKYEYINEPAYLNILGYSEEELLGKSAWNFVHPEDIEHMTKKHEINTDEFSDINGEDSDILRIRHKNGHYLWLEYKSRPFIDEKGNLKVFCVGRDITERKAAEEKLQESMEDLKSSNQELQEFAYIISHDLQEPLRMVSSFTQLIEKRYKDKLDNDADDFINYIMEGTSRMHQLINDLLKYSRVETRGGDLQPTDMNFILEKAKFNLQYVIEQSQAKITNDPLQVINADPSQMVQLFQNLISNAIKFNDSKTPEIHISGCINDDTWEFSIEDNGIGIDTKDFERIFIIFRRLHKRDEYEGTGIGLAVCKRIINRHKGKIWVESKLGKGSKFFFSIPKVTKT